MRVPGPLKTVSVIILAAISATVAHSALPLEAERAAPTDLAVTGQIAGLKPGDVRFVRWAELARLPTHTLKLSDEFVSGVQEVTIVYLSDLWKALPVAPTADTVLATCTDGYAGVFTRAFTQEYRPFLVLSIDGAGPDRWPPPGLAFNPGPYVVSVSAAVVPAVGQLIDVGHKKPWGVTTLEFATYRERFAGFFSSTWATLSSRAEAGRELWIHSCASCHTGPAGTFGGTKAGRAFDLLASQARENPAYFKRYVREPKSLAPGAAMEPHPHYTDEHLAALVAFVTAERPPP
jgi:cytochrome c2